MTYELVLAIVPPSTPDPVQRAYELMDPFFHTEECCQHRQDEENYDEEEDELPRSGHLWDGANVGGRYHFSGCLWRDRYGLPLPDHPIDRHEDEARRVSDLDLRFLRLSPTGLVTPDRGIYFMAGRPGRCCHTIAEFMAYEDRLAGYPDHLAFPMACHS